jgi:RNA polymerase sigma-70 factor (ECF subfamily)
MDVLERRALHEAMVRLAGGDRSAFHPVYAALWPLLRAFAARLMSSEGSAEDAAQSALLKLFENASAFDRERDAVSWALGIVAFECRSRRKTEKRHGQLPPSEQLTRDNPEDLVIAQDLERAANEILGTLRPADLEILRAAVLEERGALGLLPATFRKRLQRALARLRVNWRAKHGTD